MGSSIDMCHDPDLLFPLGPVILVDEDRIGPQHPLSTRPAEGIER